MTTDYHSVASNNPPARATHRRADEIAGLTLLVFVYLVISAAAFSGYFSKVAFFDGKRWSLVAISEGTTQRPFVHRQLVPLVGSVVEMMLPAETQSALSANRLERNHIANFYARATDARSPRFILRYYVSYFLVFGCFVAALFFLRSLCIDAMGPTVSANLAPLAFAVVYPLLMTPGGFYYDPVELFFMSGSALLARQGRYVAWVCLAPLATLNKESYVFFALTLVPFLPSITTLSRRLLALGLSIVLSLAAYGVLVLMFIGNDGGPVEHHLYSNLQFFVSPSSYLRYEWTYGLPHGRGFFIANVIILALVLYYGVRRLPARWRRHSAIALSVNLPLYLFFSHNDEVRAFSLCFVALTGVIAGCIQRLGPVSLGPIDPAVQH